MARNAIKAIIVFVVLAFICSTQISCKNIHAGASVLLTEKGLNFLFNEASEMLKEKMKQLRIAKIDSQSVQVTELKINNINSLTLRHKLHQNSYIQLFGAAPYLEASGRCIAGSKSGALQIEVRNLWLYNVLSLSASKRGGVNVHIHSCAAKVGSLTLKNGASIVNAVADLKGIITEKMEKEVCSKLKTYFYDIQEQLNNLPVLVKLIDPYMLNVSLVLPPLIMDKYIDGYLDGQILQKEKKGSPFGPNAVHHREAQFNKMINVFISDYVINSGLYQATLDPIQLPSDNPLLKPYVKIPCHETACLVNLFNELKGSYPPNSLVAADVMFSSPGPRMSFTPSGATFNGSLAINLRVKKGNNNHLTKILKSLKVTFEATVTLKITELKLVPRLKITSLDFEDFGGGIDRTIASFASKKANKFLSKGFKVPATGGYGILNPLLQMKSGIFEISTDIQKV